MTHWWFPLNVYQASFNNVIDGQMKQKEAHEQATIIIIKYITIFSLSSDSGPLIELTKSNRLSHLNINNSAPTGLAVFYLLIW